MSVSQKTYYLARIELIVALTLAIAAGCGSSVVPPGPSDAGQAVDTGTTSDTGSPADAELDTAGDLEDAGDAVEDAGPRDLREACEAGCENIALCTADTLETCLSDCPDPDPLSAQCTSTLFDAFDCFTESSCDDLGTTVDNGVCAEVAARIDTDCR